MSGAFLMGVVAASVRPIGGGGPPADWQTAKEWTVDGAASNSTGWAGYTVRVRVDAVGITGDAVRLTFVGATVGTATISDCRAQIKGAGSFDFADTPILVTVAGSPSFTVPIGGSVVSDPIALPIDSADSLVISFSFPATPPTAVMQRSTAGWAAGYKAGADTESLTATGYSGTPALLVRKVEIK